MPGFSESINAVIGRGVNALSDSVGNMLNEAKRKNNPFLNKDGSLRYDLPNEVYQNMLDKGKNETVKGFISQATGLQPTAQQTADTQGGFDNSFAANATGNVSVNTSSGDGVFKNPELLGIIGRVSKETGVPANVLMAVAQQETGGKWYDSVADGTGHSYGYMMLYDHGALAGLSDSEKQKAKTDPYTNVLVGARLLANNYKRYGNWQTAMARYNGSGPAAEKYGRTVYQRANSQAYMDAANQLSRGGSLRVQFPRSSNRLVNAAQSFIGTPYVWGGSKSGDGGLDCSGFVYNALNAAGYNVGRTTAQGYRNYGQRVSTNSLQPGDLLFFGSPNNASHIGIYIGNGQMIHSSGGSRNTRSNPGKGVTVQNVNYRRDLVEARRL